MLIYLAVPYSHDDPSVRHERFEKVNEVAARLMEQGFAVFSPISHSHPIEQHMDADKQSWEFWQNQDLPILAACDVIYVLRLEGWQKSVGVDGEIKAALEQGKTVHFIDYEDFVEAEAA